MILVLTQESFVYTLDSCECLAKPTSLPSPPSFPFPPSLTPVDAHSVESWDRKVDIAIFVRRVVTTIDCGK